MIYVVFFILCIWADKLYEKQQQFLYRIVVISIYIFLCFGYMTGSDWRAYEVMYENELMLSVYNDNSESGFVFLVTLCKSIIKDFWIFNAIMKCFYLYSLTRLISLFISNKWTAIGFSFTFSTIFMLINCPMRFMIGMSFVFIAFETFIKKRYIVAIIMSLLALSFHVTMIVPIVVVLSTMCAGAFIKINKWVILFAYIVIMIMSTNSLVYEYLSSYLTNFNLDRFEGSDYLIAKTDSIFTIGTIKNIIILIFLLYHRNLILKECHGEMVYYLFCLYFLLSALLINIPSGFRLGILQSYFVVIALAYIIKGYKQIIAGHIMKYSWIVVFSILTLKYAYSSPFNYPYTNSIPYILTNHLPYEYRDSYNFNMYTKLTGKPISDETFNR